MAYNRIMHIIPDGLDELMINNIKAWSGCQDFQCSAEPACIFGGNATTLCLTVMSGDYFYANQAAIVHRPDRNSNMILIVGYRFSIEEKSRFHRHGIDFIEIEIGSDVNRMEQTFLTSLSFFIDRYRTWFDLKNKINNYIEDSFQIVVANIKLDQANKKINELNHRLEISSRTDFLTRLLNRRAIYELMEIEINRSRRLASDVAFFTSDHPRPDEPDSLQSVFRKERELNDYVGVFSIALCDIDHFKQLNDQYGHLEGDNILRALGSLFSDRTIFRPADVSGRYGGEEFLLLFPDTSMRNARYPLEKFMTAVRNLRFPVSPGKIATITISIGVTELDRADTTIDSIIKRADDALYKAKETGRDKIVFYSERFISPDV